MASFEDFFENLLSARNCFYNSDVCQRENFYGLWKITFLKALEKTSYFSEAKKVIKHFPFEEFNKNEKDGEIFLREVGSMQERIFLGESPYERQENFMKYLNREIDLTDLILLPDLEKEGDF